MSDRRSEQMRDELCRTMMQMKTSWKPSLNAICYNNNQSILTGPPDR